VVGHFGKQKVPSSGHFHFQNTLHLVLKCPAGYHGIIIFNKKSASALLRVVPLERAFPEMSSRQGGAEESLFWECPPPRVLPYM
jgi:hypothetical protein